MLTCCPICVILSCQKAFSTVKWHLVVTYQTTSVKFGLYAYVNVRLEVCIKKVLRGLSERLFQIRNARTENRAVPWCQDTVRVRTESPQEHCWKGTLEIKRGKRNNPNLIFTSTPSSWSVLLLPLFHPPTHPPPTLHFPHTLLSFSV